MRNTVSSGSYLEPEIGYSRAVKNGRHTAVSKTAPIGEDGKTAGPGDVFRRMSYCCEIAYAALEDAGGVIEDVIRTRILLTDISSWKEAARAHGEVFADIRPGCTFVEVSRFIDPDWLVEIENDAVVYE